MNQAVAGTGWDLWLFGIPLLALLFFGYFRLDEVFTQHKPEKKAPRVTAKPVAADDPYMLRDPDGQPSSGLRDRQR